VKRKSVLAGLLTVVGLSLVSLSGLALRSAEDGDGLTVDTLIQRHLASIAPGERLEKRHSFVIKGNCEFRVLVGQTKIAPGPGIVQIVSRGKAYSTVVKFESGEYGGEVYVTDGKKARTAYATPADRNPMTEMLQAQQALLNEGLFGGELTTAWALLDVKDRKPRLTFRGLEDVDGVKLYELDYRIRKGGSDLTNRLYFEPEKFHHVLSTYEVVIPARMGANPADSARQRPSRYKIEERFSDFKDFNGFTLPSIWTIQYSQSQTNDSLLYQWKTVFTQSALDMEIPDQVFNLKQM
jgi:hypothetical protein